ncbi:MAG TPA: hypothetical protein PLX58_04430 [Smithellaceae bacterium]|jgi:hypothetical protein|nr:hypothetical protein [Smithellaceae bacterium]HQF84198.1 hypothetical protein [Smithellaceae bacterium]HQG79480.1 hypothetical protein [Smithellaceae bacterium]
MTKVKKLLSTARQEEQHREEWRLRLALLKESTAYRAFWDDLGHRGQSLTGDELSRFNGGLRENFGIALDPFRRAEWFEALNPYKQNDDAVVRFYYPLPAIAQVESKTPGEHRYRVSSTELKPSERLLKVDVSRKRGELLREFTLFLDLVEAHRGSGDVPKSWMRNYTTWEPDTSRFRSEAWQALNVWRLRRQRKPYSEISRMLNINISAGKMAFQRAYELIEGKPYDAETFKRENLPVRISELQKSCIDCPDRHTCTELCPDVMAYVQQDEVSQRELTTDTTDPFII